MANDNKISSVRAETNCGVDATLSGNKCKEVSSGYKNGENNRYQPHSKDTNFDKMSRDSKSSPYDRNSQ